MSARVVFHQRREPAPRRAVVAPERTEPVGPLTLDALGSRSLVRARDAFTSLCARLAGSARGAMPRGATWLASDHGRSSG
ncbi:hypothetical protein DB32_005785 [Sandaracinus amylolyticus]|uniref:Uncharacterized protein n=1 Tax=Sandaracinus amylolyticus TaxID=927083 RepID=A0A0F6W6H2_9BACT|nr:hypothetical protein DB32_005785 [Sandaracinus amylolyticus]